MVESLFQGYRMRDESWNGPRAYTVTPWLVQHDPQRPVIWFEPAQ